MKLRPLRVGSLIRDELATLLVRDFEFPGSLVTVTEVQVTDKLDSAKALISVLPEGKADEAMKTLTAAAGTIQRTIAHHINIRPMPRIIFAIDHGPENAARVEKALMDQ